MPSNAERHQHLDRSQMELVDQHGRTWLAQSEVGVDSKRRPRIAPVGTFLPAFTTPYDFLPPQKFLRYNPRRPSVIDIDYRGWISEIKAAHQAVKDELVKVATKLYKGEAARFIKEPTEEMVQLVYGNGKGPEPPEPVMAAMQGNEWILGLREFDPTKQGDVRLKPYMERWVEVRFRDVTLEDEETITAMNFTEGQEAEGEEAMTDEELDALTAPGGEK